ncbi:DUF305 domain-containing protein [Micromonospora sp. NPDC048999]|uniref:DUF305 domain-containing protein n=1 Tax=Micromonospora sp. NPDC048999 TaxID=3155391 RepID=UPI0034012485
MKTRSTAHQATAAVPSVAASLPDASQDGGPGMRIRPRWRLRWLLAGLLLAGTLAGCAGPSAAREAASPSAVAVVANGTDRAWLQLMVPMTEQLLPLLDRAMSRSAAQGDNAALPRVRAEQGVLLDRLRALRDRAGLPSTNVHAGHDMPGMVTAGDLVELDRSDQPAFERLWRARLREMLEQSGRLAQSEQASGADPDVRALAGEVRTTCAAQLAALFTR